MRYTLEETFNDVETLYDCLQSYIMTNIIYPNEIGEDDALLLFICDVLFNEFYEDYIAYEGEDEGDVITLFTKRVAYDIAIKYSYWKKKYEYVMRLLSEDDISLLQSSKMISSSTGKINNAGGTIQKSASTPTGVSTTNTGDDMKVLYQEVETTGGTRFDTNVWSNGYVDQFTNFQGKTNSSSVAVEDRSSTITREGSILELLNVLERLPASFGDEISKHLAHHFMFVYSY